MVKITRIHAREILDSRGNPTMEVEVESANHRARAMVPSGASTGSHEAVELRDINERRYFGKGVLTAIANVNTSLGRKIRGMDVMDQKTIDETMISLDATDNKSQLGANAILGVSMAVANLAAKEKGVPLFLSLYPKARTLPVPMMNVINGGIHADNGLDFQEFMIVPKGAPTFREAIRMGVEIFMTLKKLLSSKGHSTTVGDEGGFAPKLKSHEETLDFLMRACEKAHYRPGEHVFFALDCASTEFYKSGKYALKVAGQKKSVNADAIIRYYEALVSHYPIISIEDGCAEDDWEGWKNLTQNLGKKIQLVGDDIFVTNPKRFKQGIDRKIANAILVKPNQIGTVTETVRVVEMAKKAGYAQVVSHRSGETEDTFIADLSVSMETGQIKTGSVSRSERTAKYNRLLKIEEILGRKAHFGISNRR